jgi:hypothetical protein
MSFNRIATAIACTAMLGPTTPVVSANSMAQGLAAVSLYAEHCQNTTPVSAKTRRIMSTFMDNNKTEFILEYKKFMVQINDLRKLYDGKTLWALWCPLVEPNVITLNDASSKVGF